MTRDSPTTDRDLALLALAAAVLGAGIAMTRTAATLALAGSTWVTPPVRPLGPRRGGGC